MKKMNAAKIFSMDETSHAAVQRLDTIKALDMGSIKWQQQVHFVNKCRT
jgi:hypothetical protein